MSLSATSLTTSGRRRTHREHPRISGARPTGGLTNAWRSSPASAAEPLTGGGTESLIESLPTAVTLDPDVSDAMDSAGEATLRRLRRLLAALGKDWAQFSPYYQAFKHGGLVIRRNDVAWVGDDVTELTPETHRHEPSVAVWARRPKATEAYADFNLDAEKLADYAAGTGRLAIDLTDAFVETRLSLFDALVFDDRGELSGLRPLQLRWTIWLREEDLDQGGWKVLGQGPRMIWKSEEEKG
jgi:hypothetical protein